MNLDSKMIRKCAALFLVASLTLTLFGCSLFNPQSRLNRLIEDGKYEEALDYYREKRTDLSKEESELAFEKALDMMYLDYLEGKIENTDIADYVEALTKMNSDSLNNYGQKILNDIASVEESRECYEDADAAFERGDYVGAIDLYGRVIKEDPNYDAAQEQISECKVAYKNLKISEAEKYADKDEYLNALICIKDASAVLGSDSELDELLADYQESFDEYIFNSAASLANAAKYDDAIKLLTDSRSNLSDTERCDKALVDYKDIATQEFVTQNNIDGLIADGKYTEAIGKINTIKDKYSGSPLLESVLTDVSGKYVEYEMGIINSFIDKHDYEAAYDECVEALKWLPAQSDLVSMRDYCSQRFPVLLDDYFNSGNYGDGLVYGSWMHSNKEVKDLYNNNYEKGTIITSCSTAPRWADFYLNGNYSILSLGVVVQKDYEIDDYTENVYFRVYGDDKLIYELKVTNRTTPDKFDIDVSGVNWLRIEGSVGKGSSTRLIVIDPVLKYA